MFDIRHYQGDVVKLLKMQVDAEEKQALQNERGGMERRRAEIRKNTSTLDNMSGMKTETVPGGRLLCDRCYTDCSEGTKRSQPSVCLPGVAHTGSSGININIDGFIRAGAARAAALEVIANFAKADFGQATKGK